MQFPSTFGPVTMTFTFGDRAENGPGMQHVLGPRGALDKGLDTKELMYARELCKSEGLDAKVIDLRNLLDDPEMAEEAPLLICKEWATNADALFKEHDGLAWDTKAKMRGQVKNKTARHNLCYADFSQEPDYDAGRGRVYTFETMPELHTIRKRLSHYFGEKANELPAEGNRYYQCSDGMKGTGIGFHGDAERVVVIAVRTGLPRTLHFQWYRNSKPVGKRGSVTLPHGAMYAMGHKATGNDWRKTKNGLLTLRHAAGDKKFLRLDEIECGEVDLFTDLPDM